MCWFIVAAKLPRYCFKNIKKTLSDYEIVGLLSFY